VIQEFFLDRVLIEPGDGAQPPGDGRPGAALGFQLPGKPSMSTRRTANKFSEWERHQVVNWRKSSVYASRVSPRNPARNPARASRSGSVKTGWIVASAVDGAAVVIGHLPAGLRPELGQPRVPAVNGKLNVRRPTRSRYAIKRASGRAWQLPRKCSIPMLHTESMRRLVTLTWVQVGEQITQL
jgi:hypothetical protein